MKKFQITLTFTEERISTNFCPIISGNDNESTFVVMNSCDKVVAVQGNKITVQTRYGWHKTYLVTAEIKGCYTGNNWSAFGNRLERVATARLYRIIHEINRGK